MTTTIVAQRLGAIRPSETAAMPVRAVVLKRQERELTTLSQGERDFDRAANVRRE